MVFLLPRARLLERGVPVRGLFSDAMFDCAEENFAATEKEVVLPPFCSFRYVEVGGRVALSLEELQAASTASLAQVTTR